MMLESLESWQPMHDVWDRFGEELKFMGMLLKRLEKEMKIQAEYEKKELREKKHEIEKENEDELKSEIEKENEDALKKNEDELKSEIENLKKNENEVGSGDENVHTIEDEEKDKGEIKRSLKNSESEKALMERQQINFHEHKDTYLVLEETKESLPSLVNSLLQDFEDVTFELGEPFKVFGKIHHNAYKLILLVHNSRTNRLEDGGNDAIHEGSYNNDVVKSINRVDRVGIG